MFKVEVSLAGGSDAWGTLPNQDWTLPTVDEFPSFDDIRNMLIDHRVKGRILYALVRHNFTGEVICRYLPNGQRF